jgi:hypothetical protein
MHRTSGGAPLLLLLFTPWFGAGPSTARKSLINGSEDPTPWNTTVVAKFRHISFILNINTKIRRLSKSGKGLMHTVAPTIRDHEEDERSAAKLHRAPPLKGMSTATTSTAPPAGTLINPTLCTRREPGFSHLPLSEQSTEGEERPIPRWARWLD